jgi:glycosyltransferase involved in cell wall biosynthesis
MTRLAFVVSEFPRPVDAYMLRELVALERRGLDFRIYSLRRPGHRATPRGAASLLAQTVYAPSAAALGAAEASWLRRAPRRFAAALGTAVRSHLRSPRLLAKVIGVWPQTVWFAARAREDGITHLHANWATYPAAAARAIARLTGLPWSFAGHASDIYIDPTGLPGKLRAARFVTTCTEESRRYLLGLVPDLDPARVITVHHGLDLSRAAAIERAPAAGVNLLAVGTLRDCKGYDTLIAAVARLRASGVSAELTIVGDGEDRPQLEAQARRLGLSERVRFTGYVAHEELARFYARATLLVHPARAAIHFGIPNVILEAQAARVPVVTTPLPALAELGENGTSLVHVPEDDVEQLAATLRAVLADPDRRRRLADEGFRRVSERFDISRTVNRLEALFGAGVAPAMREAVG